MILQYSGSMILALKCVLLGSGWLRSINTQKIETACAVAGESDVPLELASEGSREYTVYLFPARRHHP